jgi:hypothetical protein
MEGGDRGSLSNHQPSDKCLDRRTPGDGSARRGEQICLEVPKREKAENRTMESNIKSYGLTPLLGRNPFLGRPGNTIDFLIEIFGLSFHDAMREISGS